MFADLTSDDLPDAWTLGAAFGLTPAEARLAREVANGAGLTEACDSIGIGHETARSQMKAVFAKTGTSRQAEVARLLGKFLLKH